VSSTDESRLSALEAELATLIRRIDNLERASASTPMWDRVEEESAQAKAPVAPAARATPFPRPPAPARTPAREASPFPRPKAPRSAPSPVNLEELLGGRLLALVGGVAVLIGLGLFVALAADRGWLDVTTRIVLAFAGSGALFASGVTIGERRGRTQASLALVGTGIAGLFLSLTAATAQYDLIPSAVALPGALAIGALATAVALRWDSRTIGGLGILGSLVAPVLVDADPTHETLLFLMVAFASSTAVLVWRRWEWLRIGAFAVAMAQIAYWIVDASPSDTAVVVVLSIFGALSLVAALGFELRMPPAALRPSTSLLVALNALLVAGIGGLAIGEGGGGAQAAGLWVAGVSVAHFALGAALLRFGGNRREIAALLLGVALTSADAAFGLLVDGPSLAVGWAASAVLLAALAQRLSQGQGVLKLALAGQLALSVTHALFFDARPDTLSDGGGDLTGGAVAVLAIAFASFACGRAAWKETDHARLILDAVSIASVAYVTALVLDGTPLVLAWAGQAIALVELARRTGDRTARIGSLSFVVLAAAHVLAVEAPPDSLLYGVSDLGVVALAIGALAVAAGRCALVWPRQEPDWRRLLLVLPVLALLYLASTAIVDAFQPGAESLRTGVGLDVRQQGQALLSGFWTVTGLALLWLGLRRQVRELRLAGFGFLTLAVGKVFLYDLSELESVWRVLSFIVLGLLLLLAALAYQRMRREPVG
jgi:predicted membrane protein DUF2339